MTSNDELGKTHRGRMQQWNAGTVAGRPRNRARAMFTGSHWSDRGAAQAREERKIPGQLGRCRNDGRVSVLFETGIVFVRGPELACTVHAGWGEARERGALLPRSTSLETYDRLQDYPCFLLHSRSWRLIQHVPAKSRFSVFMHVDELSPA